MVPEAQWTLPWSKGWIECLDRILPPIWRGWTKRLQPLWLQFVPPILTPLCRLIEESSQTFSRPWHMRHERRVSWTLWKMFLLVLIVSACFRNHQIRLRPNELVLLFWRVHRYHRWQRRGKDSGDRHGRPSKSSQDTTRRWMSCRCHGSRVRLSSTLIRVINMLIGWVCVAIGFVLLALCHPMHIAYPISSTTSTHTPLRWSEKQMTGANADIGHLKITCQFAETRQVVFPVSPYANSALTYLKRHSIIL